MALLAAAGLSAATSPGWAAAAADSTSAAADTTAAGSSAPPDSAGVVEIPARPGSGMRMAPKLSRFDRPRWVMLRSLVLPGWGQMHNHAWAKAALVAAGDGTLRVRLIRDERRLGNLNEDATQRLGTLSAADQTLAAARAELAAAEAEMPQNPARVAAAQAAVQSASFAYNAASASYNGAVAAYNVLLDKATARRWIAAGVLAYALLDAYIDAHFRNFDIDFQVDPALQGSGTKPGMRLQVGWRF